MVCCLFKYYVHNFIKSSFSVGPKHIYVATVFGNWIELVSNTNDQTEINQL